MVICDHDTSCRHRILINGHLTIGAEKTALSLDVSVFEGAGAAVAKSDGVFIH